MPPVGAHSVRPPPKISNAFFQMFLIEETLRDDASIVPYKSLSRYAAGWGIPPYLHFIG